jgi:iron-sulfur cluster assembly protein
MNTEETQVLTEEIKITPEAAEQIRLIRKENQIPDTHGLRIGIQEGGCCGFSYFIGFDEKADATAKVFKSEGTMVFIDTRSLPYLKGTTLQFVDGPQGKGFRFENPNNQKSCDCDDGCCG